MRSSSSDIREVTLAARLWKKQAELVEAEDALANAVLKILGADPDEPWPFVDVTHDWHDCSYTLIDVDQTLVLSKAQQLACWDLGLHRVVLRYRTGTPFQRVYEKPTP